MKAIVAILGFAAAGVASADTMGRVQADPSVACVDFKPHELCFEKPKDGIARAEYLSEPFYAVILRTTARCSLTEGERLQAQALFPGRKVFATRFYCGEDIEENISYTNVDEKYGFLAVYAGVKLEDANKLLRDVRAMGRFHGANMRRMQAKLVYP
jgi:hypothetical protein